MSFVGSVVFVFVLVLNVVRFYVIVGGVGRALRRVHASYPNTDRAECKKKV
jgi:uncharacterized membrane protein